MKHFAILLALLLISPLAMAKSDKAAFTIWVDDACYWFSGETGEIVSMADLHAVMTNNGLWSVNCSGEVIAGTLPEKAMTLRSPSKDDGLCCLFNTDGSLLDCTDFVHVTVTPSGKSTFQFSHVVG